MYFAYGRTSYSLYPRSKGFEFLDAEFSSLAGMAPIVDYVFYVFTKEPFDGFAYRHQIKDNFM